VATDARSVWVKVWPRRPFSDAPSVTPFPIVDPFNFSVTPPPRAAPRQSGAVLPCCSTRVEVYSHVYAILSWLSTSFRRMSIACRYAPLQATSGDEGTQDHLPHQGRESFSDSISDDREGFSSDSAPLIGGRPCSPINSVGNSFLEGCQFFTTSLSPPRCLTRQYSKPPTGPNLFYTWCYAIALLATVTA
jgi:hypothetical protein